MEPREGTKPPMEATPVTQSLPRDAKFLHGMVPSTLFRLLRCRLASFPLTVLLFRQVVFVVNKSDILESSDEVDAVKEFVAANAQRILRLDRPSVIAVRARAACLGFVAAAAPFQSLLGLIAHRSLHIYFISASGWNLQTYLCQHPGLLVYCSWLCL
mgnify:CR=1 FL=1